MAVPTFHCLGIYWSPEGGEAEKSAGEVPRGRPAGLARRPADALQPDPGWKNPGKKTPECKADYRGSIVNLKPGTTYEIALTLEGTETRTSLKAATWNENFPSHRPSKCQTASYPQVNKSGTPEGYVLYDGTGGTIDSGNNSDDRHRGQRQLTSSSAASPSKT